MRINDTVSINNIKAVQPLLKNKEDSVILNIQKQIANIQERMQSLSENDEISPEKKLEKMKELQDQLAVFNRQLTQRQLQLLKEKNEKSTAETKGDAEQDGSGSSFHMDASVMQGIFRADAALSQEKVAGAVKTKAQAQVRTLEDEIKADAARGADVSKKKQQLAEAQKNFQNVYSDMAQRLSGINKKLKETAGVEPVKTDNVLLGGTAENETTVMDGAAGSTDLIQGRAKIKIDIRL